MVEFEIELESYKYPRVTRKFSIRGYAVGDLAVHKQPFFPDENPDSASPNYASTWAVSHIPSGKRLTYALPARFYDRGAVIALKRDLVDWARKLQEARPEVFDALRDDPSVDEIKARIGLEAVQDFIAIARSL
jgi:hypothetical protein